MKRYTGLKVEVRTWPQWVKLIVFSWTSELLVCEYNL